MTETNENDNKRLSLREQLSNPIIYRNAASWLRAQSDKDVNIDPAKLHNTTLTALAIGMWTTAGLMAVHKTETGSDSDPKVLIDGGLTALQASGILILGMEQQPEKVKLSTAVLPLLAKSLDRIAERLESRKTS
ncbi:hypothetical protein A3A76_00940 [Candidatus Woesebacteria bacterium RIFCSPLOWO2_01_FULL_39_23]|uniref:Uncharacterized protein n=1 Tax=Candidatus Woesebacteria bacterium RIFCSPHIGHO2_01_FULL_40_22 TaxID=1802499 RepID=A0A1F7YHL0_9BACT|nr:MAG: hypothetical protein A2141_05585 [Candidatus Woesebacteria bacterium RBG_16_40_11]OGM26807.1 MAG: hypothetical protein A2628_04615 [Candidatus Woesebacteria bacterium RIFCSPHIGHO2_01_FULL_40_22]OGM38377.1 MAG: hypothetical protein A3E41_02430 [Candidatus Woesebacteria bacterium RIFCSPHIGHO2_12_FULL_38_9]OGM63104.1 MAG: hypothetical protein A3A76_00940 [Candidatus Woesebacteria bacterium RIFCSPLOWO2_01_FULL_39_23]